MSPTDTAPSMNNLGRYITEGHRWKVVKEYIVGKNYCTIPIGTIINTHGYCGNKISCSCSLGGGSISEEDILDHCEYLYLDIKDPIYIEHRKFCDARYTEMNARHKKLLGDDIHAQAKITHLNPAIIDRVLNRG